MSSKVTYWQLSAPLPFAGKPGLIDALRITSITDMTLMGATIVYEEAWTLKEDASKPDLVTTVLAPPGSGSKHLVLFGAAYRSEAAKLPEPGLTREQDLLKNFYLSLAASRPEYAGTLVVADTP